MDALTIIMRNNVFKFGDTYWCQLVGTAMGASPACDYVTIYFGIHKILLLSIFGPRLPFYCRYINDGFGIWEHDANRAFDKECW